MVVRALRSLDVEGVRVNERHDIVLDSPESETPLKVSGSAYKLTRLRSVHHGTCLLNSPNLRNIGKFLKSPAKEYIKARGVDSVSSPIANVEVQNEDFEEAVIKEFKEMYGAVEPVLVGEEEGNVPEIMKGVNELKVCIPKSSILYFTNTTIVTRLDLWTNAPISVLLPNTSRDGRVSRRCKFTLLIIFVRAFNFNFFRTSPSQISVNLCISRLLPATQS